MEFELTGEIEMLQQSLRRFVTEVVVPNARAWDRDQTLPRPVLAQLAEMGMLGIMVPADHDGAELGVLEMTVAVEELARGDGALALAIANHNALSCAHLVKAGNPEQRSHWLGPLARGERLGAWACPQPSRRGGPEAGPQDELGIHAERDGGCWRLSGADAFVPLGNVADLFVVVATTESDEGEQGVLQEPMTGLSTEPGTGLTAFVIERGRDGLSPQPLQDILGVRAAGAARLVLESCAVPDSSRLGGIGGGGDDARALIDVARVLTAATAVGLGTSALLASRQYAKERQQFGHAIAEFQAIQWKIADMATELSAARLLTRRAAWLHDTGQPFTEAAAMAKLFAGRAAMSAADQAIQIHGGFGYTAEFPPERLYRDARWCSIDKGSDDKQRMLIAKQLLAQV